MHTSTYDTPPGAHRADAYCPAGNNEDCECVATVPRDLDLFVRPRRGAGFDTFTTIEQNER